MTIEAETDMLRTTFSQRGRVAVVTGASSGIGRHVARTLARAGATVCAVARRADRLEELAADVPGVVPLPADLIDDYACAAVIEHVVDRYGGIDVLVNNAGVSSIVRAENESADSFRRVLELNLVAPFALSAAAARHMLRSDRSVGGCIVNVASIVGLVGLGRMPQASYAASKAGLVNLTRELAAQWARHGIRVNAIAPGWFSTEMTRELFEQDAGRDWVARLTPMGRHGELEELDSALLFLVSPASSYVTGIVLPVDGGWTAV